MSIKEFFTLVWINFVVCIKNVIEFGKVAFCYYGSFSFLKADLALRLSYLFNNPFKISKKFLEKKGAEDIYAYGETPLTSLEIIARECGLNAKDRVYELGCGRGRTCFWLHSFIGCSVVGIEYIPEFVERANSIKDRLSIPNIEFRLADMTTADMPGVSVCYLYGSCLDDKTIKKLADHFSRLPAGTKLITVSYSLTEYSPKGTFEVMKRFTVPYTWGDADVFLQVVT
ncbi:MAG TPA: methyltransferase domain-containing protein [Parachlamydiaceae bacterium]|nr:methyltransferase domain-containing protein [Parachlamydiaceae bacterium]